MIAWHTGVMRWIGLIFGLLGCADKHTECEPWIDSPSSGRIINLPSPEGTGVQVQIFLSTEPPRGEYPATVVFVQGGWHTDPDPLTQGEPSLRTDLGHTVVYAWLPKHDRRGADSRRALGTAIQYAGGLIADADTCTLEDRLGGLGPVVLAGFSNGGNLAWATAGDPSLDLPHISGIATFETPPSSQFITMDPGTQERRNKRFDEALCAVPEGEIDCAIDYSPIIATAGGSCSDDAECLAIDNNGNGSINGDEFVLGALNDTESGLRVSSLQATEAAERAGILPESFMSSAEASDFWSQRVGARLLQRAADRHKDLAAIVTGTERDHMQTALTQHVHTVAQAEAIAQGGIGFIRLHPDSVYLEALHGDLLQWQDLPAATTFDLRDMTIGAEPEENQYIRATEYLDAAVLEIIDRSRTQDWSENLNEPLSVIP